jgi:RNA polymerase sigma-70 factor (ECF subfamily)
MDAEGLSQRLSRMSTQWTLLAQAHAGPGDETANAQRRLMQRYCGAAYRYLLAAVRDENAALDLCQEFAVRFLRGDFRRAAADRGRFRDYVKTALRHLVTDHHRTRQAQPQDLPPNLPAPSVTDEDDFLASWREELLCKTWAALASSHPPLHAVLRAHAEQQDASAAELGAELGTATGRPLTAGNVRVTLHRARTRFAELLVAEVAHSLGQPTQSELTAELDALGFRKLCGPALGKRDV